LETASERHFERLIPAEWTTDHPRSDYGIDLRVHIFQPIPGNTDYRPSGLEFAVQLKATDSEASEARRVGVSFGHTEYWGSLPYPVLMVRFAAATETMYARWVHARPTGPEAPGLKQAWFRFTDDDVLDEKFIAEIPQTVAAFRAARESRVHLPVRLRFEGDYADALTATRWNDELATLMGRGRVLLDIQVPSPLRAVAGPDIVGVDLGGGIAAYSHLELISWDPSAHDVLFGLGVCLARSARHNDAAECFRASPGSVMLHDARVFIYAFTACFRAGDINTALELAERYAGPPAALEFAFDVLAERSDDLDGAARFRVEELLSHIIDHAKPRAERGRLLFQRAKILRSFSLHIEALMDMEKALRIDSRLKTDWTYWAARAGSEFMLEKFADSVRNYERAIDLGAIGTRTRMLRSDALLHAGRYADVLAIAAEVTDPEPQEECHCLVAARIIERFGISEQHRDPDAAEALMATHQAEADPDAFPQAVGEVAALDALTAVMMRSPGPTLPEDATTLDLLDLLVAVHVGRQDPRFIAVALAIGLMAEVPKGILTGIAELAKRRYRTDLKSELVEVVDAGVITDPQMIEDLFAIVASS
jgi:tetratricopeptide (TPR) repeat protein